jgi:hypothetical protein
MNSFPPPPYYPSENAKNSFPPPLCYPSENAYPQGAVEGEVPVLCLKAPATNHIATKRAAHTGESSAGELQSLDIVCGRGAPTNFHYGNHVFRELLQEYQTSYLCAKRSVKPNIALEILDVVKAGGARFVRREKTPGGFSWVGIQDKGAYEKVCQGLRDGAPDLRRQMLSSSKHKAAKTKENKKEGKEDGGYHYLAC